MADLHDICFTLRQQSQHTHRMSHHLWSRTFMHPKICVSVGSCWFVKITGNKRCLFLWFKHFRSIMNKNIIVHRHFSNVIFSLQVLCLEKGAHGLVRSCSRLLRGSHAAKRDNKDEKKDRKWCKGVEQNCFKIKVGEQNFLALILNGFIFRWTSAG